MVSPCVPGLLITKDDLFQQSVVEEAITYIEVLQKQLLNNMEKQEESENCENSKITDDQFNISCDICSPCDFRILLSKI